MKNLAYKKSQTNRIKEMRYLMGKDLEAVGRPFGEFIPGGNAAEPGQIDKQIEIVKQLIIKGKTVTVPEDLKKNIGVSEEPNQDDKAKRKKKREARKKTAKMRKISLLITWVFFILKDQSACSFEKFSSNFQLINFMRGIWKGPFQRFPFSEELTLPSR